MQNSPTKSGLPQLFPTQEVLSPVMSAQAFALWGIDEVVYIKPVESYGDVAWGIFAADGTLLGTAPERALAFAAALQNDRVPMSVN